MKAEIPLIIASKKKYGHGMSMTYHTQEGELEVLMPELTNQDVETITKPTDIHELSIREIISFYEKVGKLWGRRSYDLRKDAVKLAEKVTGYSEPMIQHSYDQIAGILSKSYMEHTLDAEIRDKSFLDEWIRVEEIYVHAQPRGKVLHILAGNAPPITAVSILRGSLTKNVNILKMAGGDLVTPVHLALTFEDVDKDHPITKTTSVVYWKHEHFAEDKLINASNVVCMWGGQDAIDALRRKTKQGIELLEFGPRRSMQFIGRETFADIKNIHKVTDKIAHDIVLFDQEACHSPQLAFVEGKGNAEKFCESLAKSLDREGKKLPKGFTHQDKHAAISHERVLAKFYGEKVYESEGTEWTIIISDNIKRTMRHPLGRTLYVFEIKSLTDALQHIDKSVQTVSIYPEKRINQLRDEITLRGADRVTHIGRMGYFAVGAPHDGIYPLTHLIRWVKSR